MLNEIPVSQDTFRVTLGPGDQWVFSPGTRPDFSGMGSYRLEAEVFAEGESFTGNNHLARLVTRYPFPDLGLIQESLEEENGVRAGAVVRAQNLGNVPVDSLIFGVWMDGIRQGAVTLYTPLDPGGNQRVTITLADSAGGHPGEGFHGFMIRSEIPDSVPGNDMITGVFCWQGTDVVRWETTGGLTVYPNPSAGEFHVKLDTPAGRSCRAELRDVRGLVGAVYVIGKGEDHLFIPPVHSPGFYLLGIPGLGVTLPLVVTR
ncbi:MAG: hypothetical protein EHM46_05035 [Bacteroidetes bacterium]|nr:MAG: hypothetical protein EHM46_05035 [Bacteroidota bacterium]